MEEQMPQFGATEHAAELARLRARQHYEATSGTPIRPILPPSSTSYAGMPQFPGTPAYQGTRSSTYHSPARNLPTSRPTYFPQKTDSPRSISAPQQFPSSAARASSSTNLPSLDQIRRRLEEQLQQVKQLQESNR